MEGRGDGAAGAWLASAAQLHAEALAAECAGVGVSWSRLAEQVFTTTSWLDAQGIARGDVVAVLAENALAWPRWLHALAARGATLLALNLRATSDELGFQLGDAGARLLVAGPGAGDERVASLAGACPWLVVVHVDHAGDIAADSRSAGPGFSSRVTPSVPSVSMEEPAAGWGSARPPAETRSQTSPPLAVLYTSGTSGRPKGVALAASNFEASARAAHAGIPLEPGDRWLVCMPLFHVGGLSILVRSALAGATAVIHPRFDEAAVVHALWNEGITHVSFVAAQLARVMDASADRPAPPGLRCVLLGGGPAPGELIERAWRLGWPVSPTYGLTEACSQVATRAPGDRAAPVAGRLRALTGVEVCVRGVDGVRHVASAEGEIVVRGPNVTRGYVGHASARAPVDGEGWLATGDIGRLDAEGLLEVLERRDDLIVSGGENIYPAEVEAVLLEHAAVAEAAVVARRDVRFGARPVAYWVRRPARAAVTSASLEAHLRARLSPYKVPVEFVELAELPRTAAGKLQRARLRAIDEERARD